MKITVIGSSHGVPEPNRKCACILLELGERVYFIDMGANAVEALRTRGIPVESVRAVFITHMHGDHTNGLIPFVDLLHWYFTKADPEIFLPNIRAAEVIGEWLVAAQNECKREMRYRQTAPGLLFDDGALRVTAVSTQHCANSYAYLIEAEGRRVLFTGDLKRPGVDFPACALEKPLDLLVCESAHFPATEYLPVLENARVEQVCFTHYSDTFLPSVLQTIASLQERGVRASRALDGTELRL
ncbi:MAG: MBL fold metallo-hydrolase [Eubacteriales bacterium]|nr:MBL fold metallo-hydrolase [Eubacteriales bacterium]